MNFVSAGVDVFLLLRVLGLKLHRTYVFITLACVLTVFFDAVYLWPGIGQQESDRAFYYSRFLYALVFPIAAWDVFEELKAPLAKLRRLAISRTITSLVLIAIFGLAIAAFVGDTDGFEFVNTLAKFIWTGSAAASLSFLWVMHKGMRDQKTEAPRNTFT